MIPIFPNFKKLELSDKQDVEKFTFKFPPYSDFNFVSMWSWNINDKVSISILNNNLVIRFSDYMTGKPFYSFLGDAKLHETVEELFKFLKKENSEKILRLISEEIGHKLKNSKFYLSPDQNSHDYIYTVSDLANMHSWTKHSSGKNIRSFIKKFPNYVVVHEPIKEIDKNELIKMFKRWGENKKIENHFHLNEYKAFARILTSKFENLKAVLIYANNVLVGFTIYEIINPDYAISHFAKADTVYNRAIGDVLNWEEAKILDKQGIKFFNWEQDLGIPGLRKSKEKLRPSFLFKKLIISYKD